MIPGEGSRQMENATLTATATTSDWRQAWRAFAEQASRHSEATHDEVAQATLVESRGGMFRGFGSPPGRF